MGNEWEPPHESQAKAESSIKIFGNPSGDIIQWGKKKAKAI